MLGDFHGDGVRDALGAIPRLDQQRVVSGRGFAELRRDSISAIIESTPSERDDSASAQD